MVYFCCSKSFGKLDFRDFLQKSFITSTNGLMDILDIHLVDYSAPMLNFAESLTLSKNKNSHTITIAVYAITLPMTNPYDQ